jgi:hypothetical protein
VKLHPPESEFRRRHISNALPQAAHQEGAHHAGSGTARMRRIPNLKPSCTRGPAKSLTITIGPPGSNWHRCVVCLSSSEPCRGSFSGTFTQTIFRVDPLACAPPLCFLFQKRNLFLIRKECGAIMARTTEFLEAGMYATLDFLFVPPVAHDDVDLSASPNYSHWASTSHPFRRCQCNTRVAFLFNRRRKTNTENCLSHAIRKQPIWARMMGTGLMTPEKS